ncbi:MAG: beta-lactamase family protein [Chitinophagales bacterium]|jgi:CubicO group peptidase (beta-lactamase class C family)|nr:beta-lactamase family protein [Chitinophagales bacterium]
MKLYKFSILVAMVLLLTSFNTNRVFLNAKKVFVNTQQIQETLEENAERLKNSEVIDMTYKHFIIDSIFRSLSYQNKFNGSILVAQNGKVIYKNAFGMANPVLNEPLSTESIFQLASVSKTITAVGILMLVEKQIIGLDDYVALYLKGFPYHSVTIRQLLNHTSGLPNYLAIDQKHFNNAVYYYTNDQVFQALKNANLPYNFTPGSKFVYNNSNYVILAYLIEQITGQPFAQFVKNNIFDPLQMKNSYIATPEEIWAKQNRTFGIYPNKYNIIPTDAYDGVFGDKGAYSTVEDMYKFDRALYPNVLLNSFTLEQAFTNQVIGLSKNKKYGLGFRLREDQNYQRIVYHNGWWHGYRTAFHRRESDNSCVIIMSNMLNKETYQKAKELFNILDNNYYFFYQKNYQIDTENVSDE